jgi:hypothetical protein
MQTQSASRFLRKLSGTKLAANEIYFVGDENTWKIAIKEVYYQVCALIEILNAWITESLNN